MKTSKTKKKIPKFKTEKAEREFWSKNDSTDFINWQDAAVAKFSNLKPSTKSISVRLPNSLLDDLKVLANKKDIPYQSLLKIYLAEKIDEEFKNKKVS